MYFFQQYLNFQVGYPQFLLFDPEKNHPFYKKNHSFHQKIIFLKIKTAFASKNRLIQKIMPEIAPLTAENYSCFTCLLCLWIFLCFLALLNKTRSATSPLRREWLWRGNKSSKRTLFQLYQKIISIVCKYCLKYLSGIPIYTPKRSMSSMSFIFFIFIECQLHKHICLIICFLV